MIFFWWGDENGECLEWFKFFLFWIGELILDVFFNFIFLGVWILVFGFCDCFYSLGECEGIWWFLFELEFRFVVKEVLFCLGKFLFRVNLGFFLIIWGFMVREWYGSDFGFFVFLVGLIVWCWGGFVFVVFIFCFFKIKSKRSFILIDWGNGKVDKGERFVGIF